MGSRDLFEFLVGFARASETGERSRKDCSERRMTWSLIEGGALGGREQLHPASLGPQSLGAPNSDVSLANAEQP